MAFAINLTFNIRPGMTEIFTFGGPPEPDDNFSLDLFWGRPTVTKDLKLVVTSPDGQKHISDQTPSAAERVECYAPLPSGVWTVEVLNKGSDRVRATLQGGFGN